MAAPPAWGAVDVVVFEAGDLLFVPVAEAALCGGAVMGAGHGRERPGEWCK
ncbi:hypothetical protein L841_5510 [Mycobacterium sp. MAC_080597_8934]|nr:hypothetical protein L841_5510 [Mycobacterium sp. MAC_080597_8934]